MMQESQLDAALYEAFDHGSIRFVQLLVDKGASFNRLSRWISVDELYKKSVSSINKQIKFDVLILVENETIIALGKKSN